MLTERARGTLCIRQTRFRNALVLADRTRGVFVVYECGKKVKKEPRSVQVYIPVPGRGGCEIVENV